MDAATRTAPRGHGRTEPHPDEPGAWVLRQGSATLAIAVAPLALAVAHFQEVGPLRRSQRLGRQPAPPALLRWLRGLPEVRLAMVEVDGMPVLHLFDPAEGNWGYAVNLTHPHNSEWGSFGGDPAAGFALEAA